ncbi:MAG: Dihydropteroate synthase [Syntrophomonadaceae bacterium]|nr:Dihydropteroate synthase [Bacillota bacterium]
MTLLNLDGKSFNLDKRTLVMGILNVTPDSFSDGGRHFNLETALRHALQMAAEGADIIDVGGESTRPGAAPVTAEEEAGRVIPVIAAIRSASSIPISVDTSKVAVAEAALAAGAGMLNDVWSGRKEPAMLELAARAEVPICLMHNRAEAVYADVVGEIVTDLLECAEAALSAGVRHENIILDPGIGFGKTPEHNLRVLNRLRELTGLGYPVLLGVSRKSVIGRVLDLPVNSRLEGTAAAVAFGVIQGVKISRVHDVLAMRRVIRMTEAMLQGRLPDD